MIFWDYGEAHHFKGSHNGLGGTVKRRIYQDVSTFKFVIRDAKHFVEYANKICDINAEYLHQEDVPDLLSTEDSVYVYGTLQIHHIK